MVKYRNYYNSKVKTCADLIQKSVDNIILAAAFALLCFSAYYLYFRPYPRNNNLNLPSVAKLSHAQNTVKYRGYDNFSWENAKGGLPLVQGDSVYTHESSGAQIEFKSGPTLSMDPYTLLKITQQDKEFALDLLSGNISAQLNNEGDHITLLLGNRKFRLSGTKAQIKIKKQGNKAQISVLKGQVKISEGEDQKKEFGVSELELTSERGIPKKANVFDIEYEDIPPDYINTFPQHEIKFSFKPPTEHNMGPFKVHVENISSGKVENFTTNRNTVSLRNLQPGFHAVKVTKQLIDKEIKTPLMNFTLEFYEPPYFSNPTTQLFIEAEKNTREIPLSIDEQEYIQVLRLIKDNITIKEMKIAPVLKANDTKTFILKHNFKEEGDYKLELKPQGISYPDYIQTSTLKVVRKDSLNVPEPLKRGKEEVLFQTIDFQKVSLKWTRAYKDSSFEVLINGTIYETTEPFLNYPLPIKGEQQRILEWKVREIVNNRKSPFSDPELLKIQPVENFLQSPSSGTRIFLEKPNQLVTFEWQGKLKKNEAFEFQVSKSADFKNPFINKKTKEQNAKTALGAKGEYYWRVKIKTNEGKVRYGSPIKIQVQPAPPPTPIKLKERIELKIQEKTSSTFSGLKKNFGFFLFWSLLSNAKADDLGSYTKLTWPSDNLAKKYILRIYKNREDKKPFLEIETDQAEYVWDNPKAGKYYWEVAIKDYWERVGEFSNRSEILLKKIPKPIDLISPKHKKSFDTTKEKTIRFKFTNVKSGEILFSSSLKFSTPLLTKKVKNNSVSLPLEKLTSFDKEYLYWRVRDGKRKSLRRRIIFTKPKLKKVKEAFNSPSVAKTKISPVWKNRLYQKVSSVTADQTGANFEAEASGLFINIIGFQKLIESFGSIPWQLEGEVGKGVAFGSLDYFQGRLSLYRHSHSKTELQSNWSFYYGLETQYQTSFEETSQPTLVAKNNALFGGLLGIRSPFHLMAPQELSLELAYGTFLTYRLNLRSHWGKIKRFPFSTVIFLENLKFEDDLNELSRTSLGLAWEFSF